MADWEVVTRRARLKHQHQPQQKPQQQQQTQHRRPEVANSNVSTSNVDKDAGKKNEKNKVKNQECKKQIEKKSDRIKQYRNIEQALNSVSFEELKETCDNLTLSDVAKFLNYRIPIDDDDTVYINFPYYYPSCLLPARMREEIDRVIRREIQNGLLFYTLEFCLSNIAYSMAKDLQVTGYKLIIQLIADLDPACFIKCIPKIQSLMNSFQNRPPIGLTLLWSIGQAGFKNINVGIQVWKETMLPMYDLKNYTKYVNHYLTLLLEVHTNVDYSTQIIKPNEFCEVFNFIHFRRRNIQRDSEKSLNYQSLALRDFYFQKSDSWKYFNFMDKLLKELPNAYYDDTQRSDFTVKEIVRCIINASLKSDANIAKLCQLQKAYPKQMTFVIAQIEKESRKTDLCVLHPALVECITHFNKSCLELSKTEGKNAGLRSALASCKRISEKMVKPKGFPWFKGCIVLLLAVVAAAVTYDVQQAGSFSNSYTKKGIEVSLDYGAYACSKSLIYLARGYKWLENNTPHYYSSVVEFSKPYFELCRDMVLIVINYAIQIYSNVKEYAIEKWPIVYLTVDYYLPGFLSAVQEYCSMIWNTVKDLCCQYYDAITAYLKTNIFVDNWAPDLLQAKAIQALNTTQTYAVECYKLFYKYVDDYSKM